MEDYQITGQSSALSDVSVPESFNYIGVFLTLSCNLRCSYCINRFGGLVSSGRRLSAAEWLQGFNRLKSRSDLPITIQGGEPSLHPDFYEIINGIRPELDVDLLTNIQFDVDTFMARVSPSRLRRQAPYASIRVSYHPETMELAEMKRKVEKLLHGGYSVGIWAVDHPAWQKEVTRARAECEAMGIDFRLKEFLGFYQGREYGTYKYADAIGNRQTRRVECRTTELLIGPTGDIYRCHSDLYNERESCGNLLDADLQIANTFRNCDFYGSCNPCDVKTKTNRFQQSGHTSVDIQF
jgi:MoaA/NifB/PqqE/SkfB family radical SAM enzyme